ncbi:MAG TPA: tyrosine-type recombinase/integrase, partial [Verrucomicrobiota bacterium]|nr:tyrosine-type recombinase/integrase [Verrucomicrobiota bacterium]
DFESSASADSATPATIDYQRFANVSRTLVPCSTRPFRVSHLKVPDLLQYVGSGSYYARIKLHGKTIRRSLEVHKCQGALTRACAKLGIARITHHDLRHLFATRCIESGVDIPTVARWLGHKDGGALAMKVYGHLRNQHSQEMAKKVKF